MSAIFFFFQAEDGIRDVAVTGVQTCALPICLGQGVANRVIGGGAGDAQTVADFDGAVAAVVFRSDDVAAGRGHADDVAGCVINGGDRKSTRLNSSHRYISYSGFCFEKNKTYINHALSAY